MARHGDEGGARTGIQLGEAGYRERAVYLIDRGHPGNHSMCSAGVPPVALVSCAGDFHADSFRFDSSVGIDLCVARLPPCFFG